MIPEKPKTINSFLICHMGFFLYTNLLVNSLLLPHSKIFRGGLAIGYKWALTFSQGLIGLNSEVSHHTRQQS